jgi:predicted SAM-dependent methyltransferase
MTQELSTLIRESVIGRETVTPEPSAALTSSARYVSETARYPGFRESVQPFCQGYGLDIGFGGDPINSTAIRMDLPVPYADAGDLPVQLGGNCRDLRWLRDEALDFVYSSHVLEDFAENETEAVMGEWVRVLRVGGFLVLLLPDQERYVAHCERIGERSNEHHLIAHFSLTYVKEVAQRLGNLNVAMEQPEVGPYSFAIALEKARPATQGGDERQTLHDQIQKLWTERDGLQVALRQREQELAETTRQKQECERIRGEQAALLNWYENHPVTKLYRAIRGKARSRKPSKTQH